MRHVIPVEFEKFPQGWHSEILASPKSGIDSCYVICSRVEPGTAGPKLHTHPADQFYFIISGTMRMQLGTDEFSVGPDTLVFIPEGTPHCNRNPGKETEIHLEIIAPAPPFESIFSPATPRTIPAAADLIRRVDRKAFEGDKFAVQFLTNGSTKSKHVAINLAEVQPDAGGPSFHIHSFDQFYYVIEGSMAVDVGLNNYDAGAHNLVVLPAGVVHQNRNSGSGVERHITILAPLPADGARLDTPVEIQHANAFGRI
jgi:mannose-6-phosphate isomerase-like protein (cupin superfamily)